MDANAKMPWGPVPTADGAPAIPGLAPPPLPSRLTFAGSRPVFRGLAMRGGLLEFVTLGFYRFWLTTDIRRHLWSNTGVGGDFAEYDGRAKELLIGFLVAIAILAPLYLVYFLAGIEAERLQAFLSVPFVLVLFVFAEFARYRARRYRVTRTIWRGLRFGMGGSGWGYAWRSVLWFFWVLLTLGIAWPWRQAALERYKMRHTAYGSLQGAFEARGGDLLARIWWIYFLGTATAFLVIPIPFLYAMFRAVEWRWWVDGLRLGDVHFRSDLPASAFYGIYWKAIFWGILLLLCLGGWSAGVVYLAVNAHGFGEGVDGRQLVQVLQHPATLAGIGFGYLLAAIAGGLIMRIYLVRDIWAAVVVTTNAVNLAAAENVVGQGALVGSLGEGLSDGLDFGF